MKTLDKIKENFTGLKKQGTAIIALLAITTLTILFCKYCVWFWTLIM